MDIGNMVKLAGSLVTEAFGDGPTSFSDRTATPRLSFTCAYCLSIARFHNQCGQNVLFNAFGTIEAVAELRLSPLHDAVSFTALQLLPRAKRGWRA